jgi:hypothetical protein
MITTYERGKAEGIREALLIVLEQRFGTPTPQVQQRLAEFNSEQLRQLTENLLTASSLKELHLKD